METAEVRAMEVLKRCPEGPLIGAEIGVAIGQMSEALLTLRKNLILHMVDPWKGESEQNDIYRASGDGHAHMSSAEQQAHYETAVKVTQFAENRRTVHRLDSLQAADLIENASLDFAVLDGDHTYEACAADMDAWSAKVKPGGLLCGHDYYNNPPSEDTWATGVKKAVDEAVFLMGWKLELRENYTRFVRL